MVDLGEVMTFPVEFTNATNRITNEFYRESVSFFFNAGEARLTIFEIRANARVLTRNARGAGPIAK